MRAAILDEFGATPRCGEFDAPGVRREGYLALTEHAARGDIVVDLERHPLEDVPIAWDAQREATGGVKRVLLPGAA